MIYQTPTRVDEETILRDLANRAKCSAWARHQLEQYLTMRYCPAYTRPANVSEAAARVTAAVKAGSDTTAALADLDGGED